jgi:IS5 family transposase
MRPKKQETTGAGDLFRARLDQIINMKHELVQLAGKIDWDFLDAEIAPALQRQGPARHRDAVRHRPLAAQAYLWFVR